MGTLSLSAGGSALASPSTLTPASFGNSLPNTFLQLPQFKKAAVPAAAGDLNGDGIPDLVVFDNGGSSGTTMGILLGNGDGTFGVETVYCLDDNAATPLSAPGPCSTGAGNTSNALAFSPAGVIIADVNSDGIPDIIVMASIYTGPGSISLTNPGAVLVFLGTGGGNFSPSPS